MMATLAFNELTNKDVELYLTAQLASNEHIQLLHVRNDNRLLTFVILEESIFVIVQKLSWVG